MRPEIGKLTQEIKMAFAVPDNAPLGRKDFWWSAACHLYPEDFPLVFGSNLITALKGLQTPASSEKEEFNTDLVLLFVQMDICQDAELRDPLFELELKREYIKSEMRQTHREAYKDHLRNFQGFNKGQRDLVVQWLKMFIGVEKIWQDNWLT